MSNSYPAVITAALLDDVLGQSYGIAKRLVTVTSATLGATGYFGQMLEKAEKRRRALGVGSVVDISSCLAEISSNVQSDVCAETMAVAADLQQKKQQKQKKQLYTAVRSDSVANVNVNRLQVIEKESNETNVAGICGSPNADCTSKKILRQFAAVDKENMDLGIEINIMTDKHVEVQVQVEEQDMTTTDEEQTVEAQVRTTSKQADGAQQERERIDQTSISALKNRNTPRKCLQRLGVLYSNTGDLSSPIHRTEGQFHADTDEGKETACTKPKRKLNKLVALADSINQWEDDITHHNIKASSKSSSIPPPKPDLPSRGRMKSIAPDSTTANEQIDNRRTLKDKDDGKTKQLKWHPKVINSLEAQGFQRRESSTLKLAYEFAKEQQELQEDIQEKPLNIDKEQEARTECDKVNINKFAKQSYEEKKLNQPAENKKMATVKPGLVSGRTALFETQTQNVQKPQKDPTELSLKERMKFFEKNKGEALIPKAPFGMAAPISKLLQDPQKGKDEQAKVGAVSSSNLLLNKCNTERNVRAKVAALIQASNENKIKEDIRKQREEDMQVLSNRFNKQKEFTELQGVIGQQRQQEQGESQVKATTDVLVTGKKAIVRPQALPPTPPPLPTSKNAPTPYAKRRSSGDAIDDDNKRARKSDRQLLSAGLSNFDSNESFSDNENNYCTTATASALNTADEMKESRQPLNRRDQRRNQLQQEEFEDREEESEDSFMEIKNCEDDISTAEAYGRDEMLNERHSHGKASKTQKTKIKEVRYADKDYYIQSRQPESSSEVSIDDYLEEALDDQGDGDDDNTQSEDEEEEKYDSHLSKGSLGTTASHSFSFRKTPTSVYKTIDGKDNNDNFQTPTTSRGTEVNVNNLSSGGSYMQPVKSELSVNKENDNMVTLVHTVSFYRREKNSASSTSTPIRKICREQQVPQFHNYNEDSDYTDGDLTQSDEEMDDTHLVQEKIEKLLDEVCKQQQVIAQASQALNLCAATVEFSGSTESVEGERHLLVATHRRQACLDEVQRLRVEKVLRPLGAPRDKGRLTVKEITLPLRKSYIQQLSSDAISGHHLVCLMKYNEHVLATKSVSTLPGLLAVKFPDVLRLNDVYADFKVTIEIYGMTAQREILPHEVKYHINLNKKGGIKTPKKKARDNGLVMPPVQPVHVMGVCPLEGVLHMKVNCELSVSVEYEGFLNMYEDVSGYGAWHRRYCRLSGTVVNYWKYPDDVKEKAPIGSIDLCSCVTQKVEVAPRDICARLNTMLLQCERPALANDVESLTIIPKGRNTIVRYLMSADSKNERVAWCAYFNKALALLRAWGPPE
uniref:PH domain-containing protein n=1 Tax=Glossina pallidipes TaxID=7398 RepID=A0A1A9ZYF2_GLOPL